MRWRQAAWTVVALAGVAIAAHGQTPEAKAAAENQARAVFAEARAAMTAIPTVIAPEYWDYIAAQEAAVGLEADSNADFRRAFAGAVALAQNHRDLSAQAVVLEVETGAINGLIEDGDEDAALGLSRQLTGPARAQGLDRLIPLLLSQHRTSEAASLWNAAAIEPAAFPFHAAAALLKPENADPQLCTAVLNQGTAALAAVTVTPAAQGALEFLQEARAANSSVARLRQDIAALWARLAYVQGPKAEVLTVAAGLRALAKDFDPTLAQQLSANPLPDARPSLTPRPNAGAAAPPATGAAPVRLPPPAPARLAPPLDAQLQFYGEWAASAEALPLDIDFYTDHMTPLAPAMETALPVATARWAAANFQAKRNRLWPPLLDQALLGAAGLALQVAHPAQIDYSSDALTTFGLVAEMDFQRARRAAERLPACLMKPLALAHVARMAMAASQNRPGRRVLVLH